MSFSDDNEKLRIRFVIIFQITFNLKSELELQSFYDGMDFDQIRT